LCLTKAKASGFGGATQKAGRSTAQRVRSARTKLELAVEAKKVSIREVLRGIEERPGEICGLVFFQGVQVVQAAQEEQIGDLLNHLNGVGNAARPKGVPNLVNLAFEVASQRGLP